MCGCGCMCFLVDVVEVAITLYNFFCGEGGGGYFLFCRIACVICVYMDTYVYTYS